MKENTKNKLVKHLNNILKSGKSFNAYSKENDLNSHYFSDYKKEVYQNKETYKDVYELFEKIEKNKIKFTDSKTDDRAETDIIRDDNGNIVSYVFTIYIRNRNPIIGEFNRDEMNMVYRLYSNYGSGITQREVSRFFPNYSLIDFKRILRAFNITKASAPFAPHVIEENDKDTLMEMQYREKENDFLRSYEANKIKFNEKQIEKLMVENQKLKDNLNILKESINELNFSDLPKFQPVTINPDNKTLIIWLSDIHIGASVSNYSIYSNNYSEEEVTNRFNKIINSINATNGFNEIIVCNLGDSLDGYNAETTRGGHKLEQNMNNKEQLKVFIKVMTNFFKNLQYFPCSKIKYYCVGESNHDGDFGYAANIALSYVLNNMNIETKVFDKFIGDFTVGNTTYLITHGKDNKDMFKQLPLTLDIKTENFLTEYITVKGINNKVVVVKGDLHQSAITYGKRFKYMSVSSIFGSSEYIHKNFGNTLAACDYSVVDENGNMSDNHIILQ